MEATKQSIEQLLEEVALKNEQLVSYLTDTVNVTDYEPDGEIWTRAFQRALDEHEIVLIPSSEKPYLIDDSLIVPSNRRIIAEEGATIRLVKGVKVLLLRNRTTVDGTHMPIRNTNRDENISIEGGIWEESCEGRMGYGSSGMYDKDRSLYGVSTCLFLENLNHLTLKNMTFRHCGGFAVQLGEISNVIIDNIRFETCFADGIHVNGNTENVHIRNVSGWVGDDLVAFNMFDWKNSSVNFGPCRNVLCEDLILDPDTRYKAIRIEPGVYTFDDGSTVDCSLNNAIFRRIQNIRTFKLYCQTPVYKIQDGPEKAGVGSGDNIFFEDIEVDLAGPIDEMEEYLNGHRIQGSFAAFELGLNARNVYLKNIKLTLYRDRFPMSYLVCVGPKSIRRGDQEIFDPYLSSKIEKLWLENIFVNGEKITDPTSYVREIVFDRLHSDAPSTASGTFEEIILT